MAYGQKIAVLGNFPPRRCGIATFTADLVSALEQTAPGDQVFSVALNDKDEGYSYPPPVRFELAQHELTGYRRTAEFLNLQDVDVLSVQHEFGIFGGAAGDYLLTLLERVNAPVVTTLHTVLERPDDDQMRVIRELCELSERLVVMSELGRRFLLDTYGADPNKVDVIFHGVPDLPFLDTSFYKDRLGAEGKTVLLTFGLLSPNKGLEDALRALPAVVAAYPEVLYVILGATHPHLVAREGERYRRSLQRLTRELGVERQVLFIDRFVEQPELLASISAADLYVTPYLSQEQITSGTLAYALGAGKAIVSTPYWHAQELLADGRGVLTPFADPDALAQKLLGLLGDDAARHALRKRAYLYGRQMVWSEVAKRYLEAFARARERHASTYPSPPRAASKAVSLPSLDVRHLLRLTDDVGMFQHAAHTVPNYREGYTTDDNARALIAAVFLESEPACELHDAAARYLAFLEYAFNPATGRFHNVMSFARQWLDEIGSEDAHGRALWALGTVLRHSGDRGFHGVAGSLFEAALAPTTSFSSPRAWAFSLLGLHDYLCSFPGDRSAQKVEAALAQQLADLYNAQQCAAWPWFEPVLSYCNAKLPHALIVTGQRVNEPDWCRIGLDALRWLVDLQTAHGHMAFVGSNGFYPSGGVKAPFDEQPVEAHAQLSACLAAYRYTLDARWLEDARTTFAWFMGQNTLGLALYDPSTGGCRDGLHPDRVNQNQGAESTLAFLLARSELAQVQAELTRAQQPLTERALAAD